MTLTSHIPTSPDSCKPGLARGVRMRRRIDHRPAAAGFPEAIVELKGPGPAIIALCDGRRTFGEIVATLAEQYRAPDRDAADRCRTIPRTLARPDADRNRRRRDNSVPGAQRRANCHRPLPLPVQSGLSPHRPRGRLAWSRN